MQTKQSQYQEGSISRVSGLQKLQFLHQFCFGVASDLNRCVSSHFVVHLLMHYSLMFKKFQNHQIQPKEGQIKL